MKKVITRENGTKRVITVNDKPTMTDQSYAKEADANYILRKFKATGVITHLAKKAGRYADCSAIPSLHESLVAVKEAERAFADLPAVIRKKFDNDYKKLALWMCDEKNREEAIELGLIDKPIPTPTPTPVPTPASQPDPTSVISDSKPKA